VFRDLLRSQWLGQLSKSQETTDIVGGRSVSNVAGAEQKSNKNAKAKMIVHIGPMQFTSLDDFHYYQFLPGEFLSLFVQHLLNHKMPEANVTTRKQLVYFVAGKTSAEAAMSANLLAKT